AEAEFSSVDSGGEGYRTNAVVNVPIVEQKLGFRALAVYDKVGGWIDNAYDGNSETNSITTKVFRAKLLAKPTDDLQISLLGLHSDLDQKYASRGFDGVSNARLPEYGR